MAIYHFAMQNISASNGKTAIASASYRSGQELYSEKEGRRYLYKRSVKPETFILVPENAPDWATDRNRLWNEVEAIEKAKNSRYAKEINLALPIELSEDEQKEMLAERDRKLEENICEMQEMQESIEELKKQIELLQK